MYSWQKHIFFLSSKNKQHEFFTACFQPSDTYFISAILVCSTNKRKVCYISVNTCMHESYVVMTVPVLVSPARQYLRADRFPHTIVVLDGMMWKHCVENCLHCGWGGCIVMTHASTKTDFSVVDSVRYGLYSVWVLCMRENLSDRYLNAAAENVSHEISSLCSSKVEDFSRILVE